MESKREGAVRGTAAPPALHSPAAMPLVTEAPVHVSSHSAFPWLPYPRFCFHLNAFPLIETMYLKTHRILWPLCPLTYLAAS